MSEVGGSGSSGMETGGSVEGASVGEVSAVGEAASSIGGIEAGSSVHEAGGSEVSASSTEGIAPAFTETEIAIDPVNTSHGLNQILETPETLERHAQISVEHYHNESIAQILDMNGKYINEADRARIENGADSIKAVEHNPNSGHSGLFRSTNGKSSIEVSAINNAQMERTTKHETNHFASKNREIIVPMPDKGGYQVYQTVGMRHTSWFHNTRTGENSGYETSGRGLNEGMTTMYTNEQLSALSKEKGEAAEREGVYSHATEVCKQLQETLGKDALGEAYYGGKTMALQEKMDALGGRGTFETFQSSMDKTLSKDYGERVQGMREAQEILAQLNEQKNGGKTA